METLFLEYVGHRACDAVSRFLGLGLGPVVITVALEEL